MKQKRKWKWKWTPDMLFLFMLLLIGVVGGTAVGCKIYQTYCSPQEFETDVVPIDWAKRYPAYETEPQKRTTQMSLKEKYSSYSLGITEVLKSAGRAWEDYLPQREKLITFGLDFQKALYTHEGIYVQSGAVRLENNSWVGQEELSTKEQLSPYVSCYEDLNEFLKKRNIPMLYINPLTKYNDDYNLPQGITIATNQNSDKLLKMLKNSNIDTLDLRKSFANVPDHYSLFYRTDHHWKVQTAFMAARKIAAACNEKYGFDMQTELLDETKFKTVKYENAVFGSYGHMATHALADSEPFELMLPKYDTQLHVQHPDRKFDKTGSFDKVMFSYKQLKGCIKNNIGYSYETLLMGNRPLTKIKNLNCKDGPKILMLRDSFSLGLAPYLALECSELDLIDTRPVNGNFTGSIKTYINQMKPDIVMLMYSWPVLFSSN